jgi:uncharacterized protein (TIGR02145 family)
MKKSILFAALCCIAMFFVACEKNEPTNNNSSKDSIDQEQDQDQDQEQEQEDGDTAVLTGTENGHDWVNLGLPSGLKWATCNVGATKPEDYGNYYAWGETATKSTYDLSTYKYADYADGEDVYALTKYCNNSERGKDGFTDTLTTLEVADDVAIQKWGSNWRMPTNSEWKELIEKCIWTWTAKNSVKGYEVKATNGNSIFLPAAGARVPGGLGGTGSYGEYWSSSLKTIYPWDAFGVDFRSNGYYTMTTNRYDGLSIRPVCK